MLLRSHGRCICTCQGPVPYCRGNLTRLCRRRQAGLPSSWRILMKACPGLGTPAVLSNLALTVTQMLPSARLMTSASATTNDFGAEPSRPTPLLSTLQLPSVAQRETRLATDLPATALIGLDFHQLDSFERFLSAHLDFLLSQA